MSSVPGSNRTAVIWMSGDFSAAAWTGGGVGVLLALAALGVRTWYGAASDARALADPVGGGGRVGVSVVDMAVDCGTSVAGAATFWSAGGIWLHMVFM